MHASLSHLSGSKSILDTSLLTKAEAFNRSLHKPV